MFSLCMYLINFIYLDTFEDAEEYYNESSDVPLDEVCVDGSLLSFLNEPKATQKLNYTQLKRIQTTEQDSSNELVTLATFPIESQKQNKYTAAGNIDWTKLGIPMKSKEIVESFGQMLPCNKDFLKEFKLFLCSQMIEHESVPMVCKVLLEKILHADILKNLALVDKDTNVCVPNKMKKAVVAVLKKQFPEETKEALTAKLIASIKRYRSDLETKTKRKAKRHVEKAKKDSAVRTSSAVGPLNSD